MYYELKNYNQYINIIPSSLLKAVLGYCWSLVRPRIFVGSKAQDAGEAFKLSQLRHPERSRNQSQMSMPIDY